MARDFLTDQARTGKIIGNNSPDSEPKLIVYSDSNASDNIGGKSQELTTRLGEVGTDTFIYIDGIPGSKKAGTADTVSVFGGDVVISGSLYAEGNASSMWEVDPTDPNNFESATDDKTRAYFAETLPNPKLQVFPIAEVADIGRKHGIPLIVDNTAAPVLCRPFDHGAAVTTYSTT